MKVKITFDKGLPVAIDSKQESLRDIIKRLNELGGGFGIGRFNGMEDTPAALGGVKNHEVREAPAAHIILLAHAHLEQAILHQNEMQWKSMLCAEWTRLAVNGGWHSDLKTAIDHFINHVSARINGAIVVELQMGSAFVSSISAPCAPSYWNLRQDYENLLSEADVAAIWGLTDLVAMFGGNRLDISCLERSGKEIGSSVVLT